MPLSSNPRLVAIQPTALPTLDLDPASITSNRGTMRRRLILRAEMIIAASPVSMRATNPLAKAGLTVFSDSGSREKYVKKAAQATDPKSSAAAMRNHVRKISAHRGTPRLISVTKESKVPPTHWGSSPETTTTTPGGSNGEDASPKRTWIVCT